MILGVMSDTHGNRRLMCEVAATMEAAHGATVIFHLGDDYDDGEALARAGHTVRRVPGLWCAAYRDGRIPRRLLETLDGVTVACAHAEKDLRHTERAAAVILTGHTHRAAVCLLGRSLYVNPGHLAATRNRGQRASYAVVDIGPETVRAAIHEATGRVRTEIIVERARLA
jgi:putative phosphoesterase